MTRVQPYTYFVYFQIRESDGEFEFGNYWKEVEDLRSVILYLKAQGHKVKAILGHSKGTCFPCSGKEKNLLLVLS